MSLPTVGRTLRTLCARYRGVLGLVAVWQVYVSAADLNSIVVPSPRAVFADVVLHPMAYLPRVWSTAWVALIGLVFAVAAGALFAIMARPASCGPHSARTDNRATNSRDLMSVPIDQTEPGKRLSHSTIVQTAPRVVGCGAVRPIRFH